MRNLWGYKSKSKDNFEQMSNIALVSLPCSNVFPTLFSYFILGLEQISFTSVVFLLLALFYTYKFHTFVWCL